MPRKIVKKLVVRTVKGAGSKALFEKRTRRVFTEEFRREAVAMLLDGHSASSVAERMGVQSMWMIACGATLTVRVDYSR